MLNEFKKVGGIIVFKEAFDKIFGSRDSFIVSGNPRTDMWQANCYGLHNQTTQDIKKKYREIRDRKVAEKLSSIYNMGLSDEDMARQLQFYMYT